MEGDSGGSGELGGRWIWEGGDSGRRAIRDGEGLGRACDLGGGES